MLSPFSLWKPLLYWFGCTETMCCEHTYTEFLLFPASDLDRRDRKAGRHHSDLFVVFLSLAGASLSNMVLKGRIQCSVAISPLLTPGDHHERDRKRFTVWSMRPRSASLSSKAPLPCEALHGSSGFAFGAGAEPHSRSCPSAVF